MCMRVSVCTSCAAVYFQDIIHARELMRSCPRSSPIQMIYGIEQSQWRAQAALAQDNLMRCFKKIETTMYDTAALWGPGKETKPVPIGGFCHVGPPCVSFTGRDTQRAQHSTGVFQGTCKSGVAFQQFLNHLEKRMITHGLFENVPSPKVINPSCIRVSFPRCLWSVVLCASTCCVARGVFRFFQPCPS